MKEINMEKIKDGEMIEVTGGNAKEFDQILAYIKENDPRAYSDTMNTNRVEIVLWLKKMIPGFESCKFHSDGNNEYYINGTLVSQEELMSMLEELPPTRHRIRF